MSKYPESEYKNIRKMSTRQQNEAKYLQSEYNHTRNMSMAGKLIRVQSEQIREDPAKYVARKYGIRGDADGQKGNLRLRGCESSGKRDRGRYTE